MDYLIGTDLIVGAVLKAKVPPAPLPKAVQAAQTTSPPPSPPKAAAAAQITPLPPATKVAPTAIVPPVPKGVPGAIATAPSTKGVAAAGTTPPVVKKPGLKRPTLSASDVSTVKSAATRASTAAKKIAGKHPAAGGKLAVIAQQALSHLASVQSTTVLGYIIHASGETGGATASAPTGTRGGTPTPAPGSAPLTDADIQRIHDAMVDLIAQAGPINAVAAAAETVAVIDGLVTQLQAAGYADLVSSGQTISQALQNVITNFDANNPDPNVASTVAGLQTQAQAWQSAATSALASGVSPAPGATSTSPDPNHPGYLMNGQPDPNYGTSTAYAPPGGGVYDSGGGGGGSPDAGVDWGDSGSSAGGGDSSDMLAPSGEGEAAAPAFDEAAAPYEAPPAPYEGAPPGEEGGEEEEGGGEEEGGEEEGAEDESGEPDLAELAQKEDPSELEAALDQVVGLLGFEADVASTWNAVWNPEAAAAPVTAFSPPASTSVRQGRVSAAVAQQLADNKARLAAVNAQLAALRAAPLAQLAAMQAAQVPQSGEGADSTAVMGSAYLDGIDIACDVPFTGIVVGHHHGGGPNFWPRSGFVVLNDRDREIEDMYFPEMDQPEDDDVMVLKDGRLAVLGASFNPANVFEVLGMFDMNVEQQKLNALKPVTIGIARSLLKGGMAAINGAIEGAKQPWYKSDLPGDTSRKNVLGHLQWHDDFLKKFPDANVGYPSADDLKKYVVMAMVEANAVQEGAQYLADAWALMWKEIEDQLAAMPKAIRDAALSVAGNLVESTTGLPLWAWALIGTGIAGALGFIAYKIATGPVGGAVAGAVTHHYLRS